MSPRDRRRRAIALAVLGLAVSACASPIRAVRVDREEAHRDVARSAITTGEPSWASRVALLERGLLDDYEDQPEATLAELHRAMVAEQGSPQLLFALAELSFLHGEAKNRRDHALAAAIYAYAFLFPEQQQERPGPLDPRLRLAADLYNWSLTAAFASEDGSEVVPRAGRFALPFGELEVAFDPEQQRAGDRELYGFIPVAELEVVGLTMRYRWPGIGAPLAASTRPVGDQPNARDMVAPRLKVPLTALLRVETPRAVLVEQTPVRATLELHLAWDRDAVAIAGESVPLETEPSAALALTFNDVRTTQLELMAFLGRLTGLGERIPLVSTTPYRPGLVPVVFVHGTASSPLRWADLFNRLQADLDLRSRYQFWFFQYDSDNPIALSALRLREALTGAVARLDPAGADPALRRMVLIGHSQGGLLVKMQSIDTGNRLWNAVSNKPLEELRLTDESRALLERGLFVEPVPEVARVVFISTPHRGSFLAASRVVTGLVRRLTHMPFQLTRLSADVARNQDAAKSPFVPTAVDNMSPRSPFILGLQQIPVTPSIPAHSIISVEGSGPIEEGDDGVVKYTSAHIEEVESERVVRSPHSCQSHPDTMEEVRRILRLHARLTTESAAQGAAR